MRYECRFYVPQKFSILLSVIQNRDRLDVWEWCLTEQTKRLAIYKGSEGTLMSAQVSAQIAFEQWLRNQREELGFSNPDSYDWQRV